MITKRKRLWLIAAACAVLVVACVILAWPATYRASAVVRVDTDCPKIMLELQKQSESHYITDRLAAYGPNYYYNREAQPKLVCGTHSLVLDTALQQPGISQLKCMMHSTDKKAWLAKHLEVGYLGDSDILEIAISGRDPDELLKIVEAVRLSYGDRVTQVKRELEVRRAMTVEEEYKAIEKTIVEKRARYKELSAQSDAASPEVAAELESLRGEVDKLQKPYREFGEMLDEYVLHPHTASPRPPESSVTQVKWKIFR